ncbi:MAG: hypothetical protein Q4A43_04195 [Coriobacteriia bacterium]|nr:hypothetical protein [Coriobacteriia bacterium]
MDEWGKRWKQLQDALQYEISGKPPRPAASMRTLFGIKSEVEEKMDRFAREIEEKNKEARNKKRSEEEADATSENDEKGEA